MQFLVILLIILAFVAWPSYGIYQRQITIKTVTIRYGESLVGY